MNVNPEPPYSVDPVTDLIDQLGRAYRETIQEANALPRNRRSRRDYLAGKTAGLSTALNRARAIRDAAHT